MPQSTLIVRVSFRISAEDSQWCEQLWDRCRCVRIHAADRNRYSYMVPWIVPKSKHAIVCCRPSSRETVGPQPSAA